MNRHGCHNIRNGVVWVQTSYNTCTCPATLCDWTLNRQEIEQFRKKSQRRKSNSNLHKNLKKKERSNWFRSVLLMRCGFHRWSSWMYTHDPHRISSKKELREFFQGASFRRRSRIAWNTTSLLLVSTSPFTVIIVVGLLDVLIVSNSSKLVFLPDHMHTRSWINYKPSFLWLFG